MNESRQFRFIITTEYFVDEEKYFYFILLHMFLIVNISVNAFCGVASILIIGILHACMLYKVARYLNFAFLERVLRSRSRFVYGILISCAYRYRMKDALKEVEASSPSESKLLSHKKMIQAILIHQKANELVYFFFFLLNKINKEAYCFTIVVDRLKQNCAIFLISFLFIIFYSKFFISSFFFLKISQVNRIPLRDIIHYSN